MQETHCLRCGLVPPAGFAGPVCPHCGRNRPSTLEKIWSTGSHYLWLIISVVLLTMLEHARPGKSEIGFVIIMAAIAVGWALVKDLGPRKACAACVERPAKDTA